MTPPRDASEHGAQVAISVVIATVGRPAQLSASLDAYARLADATPPFEVIVVLDGAGPDTAAVARRPRPYPVTVLPRAWAGIGPAKNAGAAAARGDLVVFLNDDTRPDPSCLRAHAEAQERHGPSLVVGRVDWDPDRPVTPYMTWLAPAGHQFNFDRLEPDGRIPWDACWGAHLAAPRRWILDEPFDARLNDAVLEDGEWAYRQTRRGRPLRYVPAARAWHDHNIAGPREFGERTRAAGAAARSVVRLHPRLVLPLLLRPATAALAATLLLAWPGRWRRTALWDLDYRWSYLAGCIGPRRKRAQRG